MSHLKIALIRGQFLNQFDLQSYEPLSQKYDITAFGSKNAIHTDLPFTTTLLPSPTDIPGFPKKMPILNRLFVDANYLFGLEEKLKGFAIAHTAETYYHFTQQAIRAKRKGYVKKVVTTVWENILHNNEGIWGRRHFKEIAKKEIDLFIAVSELAKKVLIEEGFPEEKIIIVRPGINVERFIPRKDHKQVLGLMKKSLTILFAGRMEVTKGVFDLLYAAKMLKKDKDLGSYTINYIFAGSGTQKHRMQEWIKENNLTSDVLFMTSGYENMPEIYEMADIFVAPSKRDAYWQEQYGMVLLEAQAAGLPIVTTQSGTIPENVGAAAIVVEEGNIKELAKAIKQFICSPKLRIAYSEKARQRAVAMHSRLLTAKKIDEAYQRVLNI